MADDAGGRVVGMTEAEFTHPPYVPAPGLAEQGAEQWWEASKQCLKQVSYQVEGRIIALAIDSTSGTLVPVDGKGHPLIPALMCNDGRAGGMEAEVNGARHPLYRPHASHSG